MELEILKNESVCLELDFGLRLGLGLELGFELRLGLGLELGLS